MRRFLRLPHGIPSHDTFARVLARLKPEELQQCFLRWLQAVSEVTQGEVVAIDGKTLRRSFDRATGKGAIHMVSAWASVKRVVLGQQKVDEKSNEITAIPSLLRLLEHDPYMLLADYQSYVDCQDQVDEAYRDPQRWTHMAILNVARIGKFSSARAIREYCEDIWQVRPVESGVK